MIEIEGDVQGDLVDLYYIPSDHYLWGPEPDRVIVVADPIHAQLTPKEGGLTHVQVALPDNIMLTTPSSNQWVWWVYEVGKHTTVHYSLTSEPRTLSYAASRPRRAQEVR
jgi:hypothetical protein